MTAVNESSKLGLCGGETAVNTPGANWPIVSEEAALKMADIVRSGNWSWVGPEEVAFCEEYKEFIGSKYCACMSNGTVTLQCGLQAVGVKPGDEVIIPGLTWVATAQAAMDIGANVVFCDIDEETMCIDPKAFEAAITEKTTAVIPVHLYGCMCDMDEIMRIAKEKNIKVVEDVAHQHGSRWRDVGAGAIGDVGSFSFQQSKVLTSGEGGAVTCNDPEVYETLFGLKQVGWVSDDVKNDPYMQEGKKAAERYCHNYRITEMQACLLRDGLKNLAAQTEKREENAAILRDGLDKIGGPLRVAKRDDRVTRQAYYALTMHFDPTKAKGLTRGQYLQAIRAEGASFGTTYPPVYRAPILNLYDDTSPIPFRNKEDVQDYST
ncbi:MAG: DegT/DnrJ/EryC1/StrS family aminotransferase, partial [Planctomycetota bacterium]